MFADSMTRGLLRLFVELLAVAVAAAVLVPWIARAHWTGASDGPAPAPPSGHSVVVAELFTSEGCSSCPPADAVLSTLIHDQPLRSVEVVGLGEHVDYWDHLGWRDPYSSRVFSTRQSEYDARVFRSGNIYTPQLVVDGQYEAVGSDVSAVRNAIVRAAGAPKALVNLNVVPLTGRIEVHVRVTQQPDVLLRGRADVMVAIAQDRLVDDVSRGENRGHRLAHSAVVRSLAAIASPPRSNAAITASAMLPLAPQWNTPDVRVVAFLQERDSRRILGAASITLDQSTLKEHTR
jgi:hypothetical protein